MRLIGISGRKGSGKSLLSDILVNKYGYINLTFGSALKNLICDILHISRDQLEKLKNENETVMFEPSNDVVSLISMETGINIVNVKDFFGQNKSFTMRELLQKLGTDLIRTFNENWHVDKVKSNILSMLNSNEDVNIVIDDVRFQNEIKMLSEFNADLFFIVRPIFNNVSNHESEISIFWDDLRIPFDNIIINNCTKDALIYEWENYVVNNIKNSKYTIFNSKEKPFDGNYYAFNSDYGLNERDLFLAGYILSQKEDFSFNCLNENGILIKTNNKFIKDVAIDVLKCDYQIINGNYVIDLYNPFIMENLKVAMNY